MKLQGRTIAAVAAIAAVTLVASACAPGDSNADAHADEDGVERIFVQAMGEDPDGFNAQITSGANPTMLSAQLMDTLIQISDDFTLSPGLAEDWEFSDDGLTLTLDIREGVTWHDGEPFTVEDVAFNFDEIIELQTFGSRLAAAISSTEIVDDSTVQVNFATPFGPALETIALQYMLPKHLYEGTDYVTNEYNMKPIGTGPMMFESYDSGEQVVFVRNPDYWGEDTVVDKVIFPIMSDPNSVAVAMFAGELDRAGLDPSQQARVSDDPNLQLVTNGFFPQLVSLMFNAKSEWLEDPEVRQAVFAALDRDAIVETALSGIGTKATGFFPESMTWALNTDIDFDADFPRDIDAINAVLDEKFPRGADGTRFTLDVRYITPLTEVASTAEMAQSMLAEVGIGVNLIGTTGAIFTEKVYTESDFDLAMLRSTVGADPSIGIVRWYECNEQKAAAANPSGICDPAIDEAAAGALTSTDQAARGEHFKALQARAAELMTYAPLAWYNGGYPTINTARWAGQDVRPPGTSQIVWSELTPVE